METEKITPKLTNLERLKQILNSENEEEEPQENQDYDYEDLDLIYSNSSDEEVEEPVLFDV